MWKDKKRIIGLKISFTNYRLSEDRLFIEKGLLNKREEEILLYRIKDIRLERSLFQRLLRLGTIEVISSDQTSPVVKLESVKNPKTVKELIHNSVESQKEKRRLRAIETIEEGDYREIE